MSSLFTTHRKGLVSLVAGPVMVAVGLLAGMHLIALGGVAVLAWGIFRIYSARAAGK